MVDVYLPGDYYQNPDQQYAVIYFLHGAGGDQNSGAQSAMIYYGQHFQNTTITSPPAIFVCMDGSCFPYEGSFYVNSVLYGDYEYYMMQDVIGFIQSGFRVVNDKEFRFICGVSMGGSGTAWLSVNYPEMFRATFPYIGFLSVTDTTMNNWRNLVYLENGSYNLNYNAGAMTQLFFTGCGAFSPNLNIPPYYIEIPFDTLGNWVDTVLTKWDTFDCSRYVKELPDANELAWFLGCGTLDVMCTYPTYLVFMDSMDFYGIDYDTCFFPGDHIFHPQTWYSGMHWMDSIINLSFLSVGMDHALSESKQVIIYPNPASGYSTIEYSIQKMESVSVTVFNQTGQVVCMVMAGRKGAGRHKLQLEMAALPSGVYLCKLQAGDQSVIKKIIKY
jgi:pimeloyl-ACP methyl ester carboxylesterase